MEAGHESEEKVLLDEIESHAPKGEKGCNAGTVPSSKAQTNATGKPKHKEPRRKTTSPDLIQTRRFPQE